MRQLLFFAGIMLVLATMAPRMFDRYVMSPQQSQRSATVPALGSATYGNARSVAIKRDAVGNFITEASVDGRRVEFIVDTGASLVALRESEAARLGIHPGARDYSVKVSTANGIGRAAMVDLGMVEVGGVVVRDLKALVHPDDALAVNLLGMSFLSRVRWNYDRGQLVLEQ
jgi:aspartyl protease family protein